MIFGVPRESDKDSLGTCGIDPEGILNVALRDLAEDLGDATVLMADTCLDEFTDHGHCGVLDARGRVDNDATNAQYVKLAVAQAQSGAHVVGPSGMMDGQVAAIRDGLDAAGFTDVAILAYAAKFASAFYGPFRDALGSSTALGAGAARGVTDKKTYQMDTANGDEALREVALDLAEGADMVMVKPAGTALDVIHRVKRAFGVPTFAYQVSGEYSMIRAAAANGWIDGEKAAAESVLVIKRAGADAILTYFAPELARAMQ
jgi:porphobilinogen synthase